MVVHRHELRATLAELCRLLTKAAAAGRKLSLPELPPAAPETWTAQA